MKGKGAGPNLIIYICLFEIIKLFDNIIVFK